jgi:hypothetical protein
MVSVMNGTFLLFFVEHVNKNTNFCCDPFSSVFSSCGR